jgi:CHAD domain-containing protein
MAYRFEPNRAVADNVRRIAIEEIDRAIARCDDPRAPEERVHDLRKRCKRLRGLVRLVHGTLKPSGAYTTENAAFRDASDGLGGVRDRQAMIETCDALLGRFAAEAPRAAFAPIRRALVRKLREESDASGEAARLASFRGRMAAARLRVPGWPIGEDGFAAVGGGLVRSYRRGRQAMQAAKSDPTPENFHEWRKRAKYHWYHLRLIEPVAPEVLNNRRKRARTLGRLLGSHHDLAMLRAELTEGSLAALADRPRATLVGLIDRRAAELAAEAELLGRKIYRRKWKRFEAEMAALWPDGDD